MIQTQKKLGGLESPYEQNGVDDKLAYRMTSANLIGLYHLGKAPLDTVVEEKEAANDSHYNTQEAPKNNRVKGNPTKYMGKKVSTLGNGEKIVLHKLPTNFETAAANKGRYDNVINVDFSETPYKNPLNKNWFKIHKERYAPIHFTQNRGYEMPKVEVGFNEIPLSYGNQEFGDTPLNNYVHTTSHAPNMDLNRFGNALNNAVAIEPSFAHHQMAIMMPAANGAKGASLEDKIVQSEMDPVGSVVNAMEDGFSLFKGLKAVIGR